MNSQDFLQKLEQRLSSSFGKDIKIQQWSHCGGGCINSGMKILLSSGESFFVKWNAHAPPDMFIREAEGLRALQKATPLRVPTPILASEPNDSMPAFLVLEDLTTPGSHPQRTSSHRSFDEILAHGLADLHSSVGPAYGFSHDNYIGSTPQPNPWSENWVEFFRTHRLEYLWKLISGKSKLAEGSHTTVRHFLEKLDTLLDRKSVKPVLLHGDLWGGNVMVDANGWPALIDPACYYGDREADLAMTKLFGGFSERFYDAYMEVLPLESGYKDRFAIYNLYHILNHALLFGGGYLQQALALMRRYAG